MRKIGIKTRKIIRIVHLFFIGIWIGASVTMALIGIVSRSVSSADQLVILNQVSLYIDGALHTSAFIGIIVTSLLFSSLTEWGFFKHKWITVKWILTILLFLSGQFVMRPAIEARIALVDEYGLAALQEAAFQKSLMLSSILGSVKIITLFFIVAISVLKPWGRRKA
jgi:hypothetical protein